MSKINEKIIQRLFSHNLKTAQAKLAELKFCSVLNPNFQGLNGWVFEQTIQDCIRKELRVLKIKTDIGEQESLGGRARADLLLGKKLAIEIKAGGLFDGNAASRYRKYRTWAAKKGYTYIYITLHESYQPYRNSMSKALGHENAFFLDTTGEWRRLTNRIVRLLANK